MSEDKKIELVTSPVSSVQEKTSDVQVADSKSSNNEVKVATVAKPSTAKSLTGSQKYDRRPGANNNRSGANNKRRGGRNDRSRDEMDQRILEIARVTRVMAGGKRMNFRACVAIGDKKGNVGVGLGKGSDVTIAVNKAVNKAKKNMVNIPIVKETIPHVVLHKLGAAKILLKPAKKGRGVISGGVTRVILELAGIKNITTKNLGSKSKINNARCVIEALRTLRRRESENNKNEAQAGKAKADQVRDNKSESQSLEDTKNQISNNQEASLKTTEIKK